MATILDIAREAGVSHGTVSNVLNQKGNVSVEKIKLVEKAAKKLGYKINYSAKSLRQGQSDLVAVIIPEYYLEYNQLYSAINDTLSQKGYKVQSYITHDINEIELKVIEEIAEERVLAVFTVSCLENANQYYSNLNNGDTDIFFIERKPDNAKQYISFDYQLAAEEVANYLVSFPSEEIGVFLSEKQFNINQIISEKFIETLSLNESNFIYSNKGQDYRNAFLIIKQLGKKVIFTNNLNRAALLQKASYYSGLAQDIMIICLATDSPNTIVSGKKYILNHYYLGIQVAEMFLKSLNTNNKKNTYIVENDGFLETDLISYPKTKLKLLTIQSPTSNAIVNLSQDFTRRTSVSLEITVLPYEEFNLELNTNANKYDLIRTDMALLAYQAKKIYQPLSNISRELDLLIDQIAPFYQEKFMTVGKKVYTLPLDPSVQMLFYREDIFSNLIVRRTFFETYKKELKLPKTFKEYADLVSFFSSGNFGSDYGTVINAKNPAIIASEFLAAYYSLGSHLVESNNSITLEESSAIQAMELYKSIYKSSKLVYKNWWNDSVQAFSDGKIAMIIGYTNHLSTIADSKIGSLVNFTAVPNDHPLLGGGVIGITTDCQQVQASSQFLIWINSPEIKKESTLLGGTSIDSKIGQSEMVHQTYPWLLSIDKNLKTGIRETNLATEKRFNLIKFEEKIGRIILDMIESNSGISIVHAINQSLISDFSIYLT